MKNVAILLVDDHPVVREGYRRLLEMRPHFSVCAEAEDVGQAYQAYKTHKPDVVVMDLALQGASGLEAVRRIRDWDKDARILIFSMHAGSAFALKAFEAGASGYITKSSPPGDLVKAIEAVIQGGRALSDDICQALAADRLSGTNPAIEELSPRETEILRLLATGLSSDVIGEMLNLSQKTVRNHHYTIKAKIGAKNDAHLVWLALSAGLVSPEKLAGIARQS
ncbi:response regulator transcription factor [Hyphomicrobium sp.]|uniref:response regulator transcription factor n=1 Tax=Hyphomicrobium sp. TaxID=82 RepID=UPI002CAECA13|nr:response regulator transcription factor [Hyphomicrobium sp.]HRN87459.1 response regulator transcription factor [Hyphomicrobium sp.]HRQ26183.1 response regulator transcription factor [Hyphomicrobium sp.]